MEYENKLKQAVSSFLDRFHPETANDIAVLLDIQTALKAGEEGDKLYAKFAAIGDEALLTTLYEEISNPSRGGMRQAMLDNPRCPKTISAKLQGPQFKSQTACKHPLISLSDTIELDLQGLADYDAMLPAGTIEGPEQIGCENRIRNLQSLFDRVPRTLHETDFTNNTDPLFPDLIAAKQRIAYNQNYFTRLCIAITNRFSSIEREHSQERERSHPDSEQEMPEEPMESAQIPPQTSCEEEMEEASAALLRSQEAAKIQAASIASKRVAERERQLRLIRDGKAREDRTQEEQVHRYEEAAREAMRLQDHPYQEGQAEYLHRQANLRDEERLLELEREQAEIRARQKEDLQHYEERMDQSRNYQSFGMEHIDLSGAGQHGNIDPFPGTPSSEPTHSQPHSEMESEPKSQPASNRGTSTVLERNSEPSSVIEQNAAASEHSESADEKSGTQFTAQRDEENPNRYAGPHSSVQSRMDNKEAVHHDAPEETAITLNPAPSSIEPQNGDLSLDSAVQQGSTNHPDQSEPERYDRNPNRYESTPHTIGPFQPHARDLVENEITLQQETPNASYEAQEPISNAFESKSGNQHQTNRFNDPTAAPLTSQHPDQPKPDGYDGNPNRYESDRHAIGPFQISTHIQSAGDIASKHAASEQRQINPEPNPSIDTAQTEGRLLGHAPHSDAQPVTTPRGSIHQKPHLTKRFDHTQVLDGAEFYRYDPNHPFTQARNDTQTTSDPKSKTDEPFQPHFFTPGGGVAPTYTHTHTHKETAPAKGNQEIYRSIQEQGTITPEDVHMMRANLESARMDLSQAKGTEREEEATCKFNEARAAFQSASRDLKTQAIQYDKGSVPATDVRNVSKLHRRASVDSFTAFHYTPNGVEGATYQNGTATGIVINHNPPGTVGKEVLSKEKPLLVTSNYEDTLYRSAQHAKRQLEQQKNNSNTIRFSAEELAAYKMCLDAFESFSYAKKEGLVRITDAEPAATTPNQRAWAARQETYRNTRSDCELKHTRNLNTSGRIPVDSNNINKDAVQSDQINLSTQKKQEHRREESNNVHQKDPHNQHDRNDREHNNGRGDRNHSDNRNKREDHNDREVRNERKGRNDRDERNNEKKPPDDSDVGGNRSRRCPKCGNYLLGPVCFNCVRKEKSDSQEPAPLDTPHDHFGDRVHAPFGSIFSTQYHRRRYTTDIKESSADLFNRSTKLKRAGNLRYFTSRAYDNFRIFAPEASSYAARKLYTMMQSGDDSSTQSIRTFEQMRYYGTVGAGLVLVATQRKIGDVDRFVKQSAKYERHHFGFTRKLSDKEIARELHTKINQGRAAKKEIRDLYERESALTDEGRKYLAKRIKNHKATLKETSRLAGLQQARLKQKVQKEILEELHRNPNGQGMVTEQSIRNLENHRKQVQRQRREIKKTQTERTSINKRISELQQKGTANLSESEKAELTALRKKLGKLDSDPRLKSLDQKEQELLKKIKGPHDDTRVPLKNVRLKDVKRTREKILEDFDQMEKARFRQFHGIKNSVIKKNKALLERQSERAKHQIKILSAKKSLTAAEKVQLQKLSKLLDQNQSKIKDHATILKARNVRDMKLGILDKTRKQLLKRKQRLRMGKMALIYFMMRPLQEGDQSGAQGLAKGISFGMNPYVRAILKRSWLLAYSTTSFVVKKVGKKTGLDKVAKPLVDKAKAAKEGIQKIVNTPRELEQQMLLQSKQARRKMMDRLTPKFIKTGKSYARKKLSSAVSRLQKTRLGKAYESVVRTVSKIKAILGTVGKAVVGFLGKFLLGFLLFILLIALFSVIITSVGTAVPSTIIMGTETTEDGKVDLTPYAEIYNAKLAAFEEDIVAAKTAKGYDNITEICYGATNYNNIKEVLSMTAVRMSQDLDLSTNPDVKTYIESLFDDSHIIYTEESKPYSCSGCLTRTVIDDHTEDCEEDCDLVHFHTEKYCPGNHVDLTIKVTTLTFDEIFTADTMGNAEQEVQAGGLIGSDFQITFYLPTGNKTASGTVPKAGRTIAVDPSVIPLGTHVIINGHEYVAEDTGGAINGHIIDIFVDSEDDIPSAGRLHNVSVYLADYVGEGVQTSGEWNGWVEENRLFAKNLYNAPWDNLYDGVDAIGTYVGSMSDYDWDSFEYSDESDLTQAQQRVAYIAQNSNLFGIPAKAGYCQQWVRLVYTEAGYSGGTAASANDAADQWLVSTDWSGIPVGAAVYGYSSSVYGHVGIYVGDGKVYHNVGGVAIDDLQSWVSKYRGYGWGWQGGHDLTAAN